MASSYEEPTSLEKLERGQAAIKIASWGHLPSWEGPLHEFAKLSNPDDDLDRRLKFFRWEVTSKVEQIVQSQLPSNKACDDKAEITAINQIFFHDLGFELSFDLSEASSMLETVLAKRTARPAILSMLYAWVSEIYFRALDKFSAEPVTPFYSSIVPIHGAPTTVVRAMPSSHHNIGQVTLLDLSKEGKVLTAQEWCPWAEKSKDGLSPKSLTESLVTALIELLSTLHQPKLGEYCDIDSTKRQLIILDRIIALKPSDTWRWADHAVLCAKLGDHKQAIRDFHRFFAFHEKSNTPDGLLELYDSLTDR